jgi:uncharacterized protein with GYD domain
MPTYILLMNATDEGRKDVKSEPERIEEGIRGWERIGGKVLGFYAVMGEYDYVAIGEAPNDEIALAFAIGAGTLGTLSTKMLRAFTKDEFVATVNKLP